jgi:hypothetical protein
VYLIHDIITVQVQERPVAKTSSSFSWLTSAFQTSNKAYLGDTNRYCFEAFILGLIYLLNTIYRYHFDPETGYWCLDAAYENESLLADGTKEVDTQKTDRF